MAACTNDSKLSRVLPKLSYQQYLEMGIISGEIPSSECSGNGGMPRILRRQNFGLHMRVNFC